MLGRASVGLRLLVMALLLYVATAGGSLATTDAVVTYDVTRSLVLRGSLALSGNLLGMDAHRGSDGRYYSPFGIAQSLFNVPFFVAGLSAERLTGAKVGKPDTVTKAAVAMGNTVAAAGCVWMTFLLAGCTTLGRRGAVTAALLVAFATVLWPYSKFGFNAPLSGLCLTGAVYGLCVGTRRNRRAALIGAGAALGAALLTRHELALAVLSATAFLVLELRHDRGRLIRGLALVWAPFACAVGIWLTLNYVRFGNPFDSGYLRDPIPGFRSPISAGLYGLLLSPSTSLFIYSPIVLAALPAFVVFGKRDRHLAWCCGSLVVVFVVFYAFLGNWAGGRSVRVALPRAGAAVPLPPGGRTSRPWGRPPGSSICRGVGHRERARPGPWGSRRLLQGQSAVGDCRTAAAGRRPPCPMVSVPARPQHPGVGGGGSPEPPLSRRTRNATGRRPLVNRHRSTGLRAAVLVLAGPVVAVSVLPRRLPGVGGARPGPHAAGVGRVGGSRPLGAPAYSPDDLTAEATAAFAAPPAIAGRVVSLA